MANELPMGVLEEAFPDYIRSRENPRLSQFLLSATPFQYGDMTIPIAEGGGSGQELRGGQLQLWPLSGCGIARSRHHGLL
jgi:hypothetical protein